MKIVKGVFCMNNRKLISINSRIIRALDDVIMSKHERNILMEKCAFTLAEVLITLGVIGIVAALTLPNVINNYKKHKTINRLKSTYSTLNNALEMAKNDYATDMNEWSIQGDNPKEKAGYFAETYLIPYLKIAINCKNNGTSKCNLRFKNLNSNEYVGTSSTNTAFALANGVFVSVYVSTSSVVENRVQLRLFLDGNKLTNINGKDVFIMELGGGTGSGTDKNKFWPYGYARNLSCNSYINGSSGNCKKDSTGDKCFALIFCENWQMTDKYPW